MNKGIITSENIGYLKRLAKTIKNKQDLSHHEALNLIAKERGFENWKTLLSKSKNNQITTRNIPKTIKNHSVKSSNKTVDPYRNLLIGATNLLLENKLISLKYIEENQESEFGHFITNLFGFPSVILWNNVGFGELRISIWWKYNHDKHPQANLEGNFKEEFTTSSPLAKRSKYKEFVGVVASCWMERVESVHLQGIGRKHIFDIYTRKGEKDALEKIPTQTPKGYKQEGQWYF